MSVKWLRWLRSYLGFVYLNVFDRARDYANFRHSGQVTRMPGSSIEPSSKVSLPGKDSKAIFCEGSYIGPRVLIRGLRKVGHFLTN